MGGSKQKSVLYLPYSTKNASGVPYTDTACCYIHGEKVSLFQVYAFTLKNPLWLPAFMSFHSIHMHGIHEKTFVVVK